MPSPVNRSSSPDPGLLAVKCPMCLAVVAAAGRMNACGCGYVRIDGDGVVSNLQGPKEEGYYIPNPNLLSRPLTELQAEHAREEEEIAAALSLQSAADLDPKSKEVSTDAPLPDSNPPSRGDGGGVPPAP